jgi:pilus assembly protein CpaF
MEQNVTSLHGARGTDTGSGSEVFEIALEQRGIARGRHRFVVGRRVSVGRQEGCDIVLDEDLVSRTHVLISVDDDGVQVEDRSTNGTAAAGQVVRQGSARIALGEPIIVGDRNVLTVHRQPARESDMETTLKARSPVPPRGELQVPPAQLASSRPAHDAQSPHEGAPIELRREIHRLLLEHLDMRSLDSARDDLSLRPRVLSALRRIVAGLAGRLPSSVTSDALVGEMADEALGLGPLERLLSDPTVTEVMVVDAHHIFIEQAGKLTLSGSRFTDEERVRAVVERILTPLGRRVDESSPLVDARLLDGSRVNVVVRPVALRGSCLTIRKFAKVPLSLPRLIELGTLDARMGRFLTRCVRAKRNIVVAGGTGSGKTTLLNVLSMAIPDHERIVTIEDAAELQLAQPHVVALESRPPNLENKGEVSIRDLVRNALRMRPDRIVVGECRGGEALDMLQAMNTGHDGSLTTTHANSPAEALARIETLALMGGVSLSERAIREQIAASIHLLVQQSRLSDGTRKITAIAEVSGLAPDGSLRLRPIFEFVQSGIDRSARVLGSFESTGYLPSFLPELLIKGIIAPGEAYL